MNKRQAEDECVKVVEGEDFFKVYYGEKMEICVEYNHLLGSWKATCLDKKIPINNTYDYPLDKKEAVIEEVFRQYKEGAVYLQKVNSLRQKYNITLLLTCAFTVIALWFNDASGHFIASIVISVLYTILAVISVNTFLVTKKLGCIAAATIWGRFSIAALITL